MNVFSFENFFEKSNNFTSNYKLHGRNEHDIFLGLTEETIFRPVLGPIRARKIQGPGQVKNRLSQNSENKVLEYDQAIYTLLIHTISAWFSLLLCPLLIRQKLYLELRWSSDAQESMNILMWTRNGVI